MADQSNLSKAIQHVNGEKDLTQEQFEDKFPAAVEELQRMASKAGAARVVLKIGSQDFLLDPAAAFAIQQQLLQGELLRGGFDLTISPVTAGHVTTRQMSGDEYLDRKTAQMMGLRYEEFCQRRDQKFVLKKVPVPNWNAAWNEAKDDFVEELRTTDTSNLLRNISSQDNMVRRMPSSTPDPSNLPRHKYDHLFKKK